MRCSLSAVSVSGMVGGTDAGTIGRLAEYRNA